MEDPVYTQASQSVGNSNTSQKKHRSGCFIGFGAGCFVSMLMVFIVPLFMFISLCKGCDGAIRTFKKMDNKQSFDVECEATLGRIPVARVELNGVITGAEANYWYHNATCDAAVLQQIHELTANEFVKGLLLVVNSPGGSVTASDNLYHALECFKKAQPGRKIFVMGGDIVASGAYYLAMQADWIRVQPTSVVGSIGVIVPGINVATLAQRLGVADNSIASGASKDLGNPLKPINPEHNAVLKTVVDGMYERFIKLVAQGRKMQLEEVRNLADGRVYTAIDAQNLRLIDDIGYEDTVTTKLAELFGCKDEDIYLYDAELDKANLYTVIKYFPQALGRAFSEAFAQPHHQTPQYRW